MREYSFRKDGFTFERVSKATARRVFNNDMPVMLCPCNLRPETGLFSTVVQNGKHLDTQDCDNCVNHKRIPHSRICMSPQP